MMHRMSQLVRSAGAILLTGWLLAWPAVVQACPNCKNTVEDDAAAGGLGANMVDGYFYSILFMMSMPFLLTGILVFVIRRMSSHRHHPIPEIRNEG